MTDTTRYDNKVRELKAQDRAEDVKRVLSEMTKRADYFDGMICIALNKDGSQFMMTSNMSGMEKAFLLQFGQSFMCQWFTHENST